MKEKERKHYQEKQRLERLKYSEQKKQEMEKRLVLTKLNVEQNLEKIRYDIEQKLKLTQERYNGLVTARELSFKKQQELNKKKFEHIQDILLKSQKSREKK